MFLWNSHQKLAFIYGTVIRNCEPAVCKYNKKKTLSTLENEKGMWSSINNMHAQPACCKLISLEHSGSNTSIKTCNWCKHKTLGFYQMKHSCSSTHWYVFRSVLVSLSPEPEKAFSARLTAYNGHVLCSSLWWSPNLHAPTVQAAVNAKVLNISIHLPFFIALALSFLYEVH